jgi:UDP-2,3-diacylglucosamine hydrolase
MKSTKSVYFASDFHLGLPSFEKGIEREKLVVAWLDSIKDDAAEIFLVGDIFDFWYEYRYVIPKGYTRFLGKVAEITDAGIPVHFFTGNHDVWMFNYFPKELGVSVHTKPITREFNGKSFLIGHGDGLGKGDNGYKLLKGIFTSKTLQWLFSRLHPNFAMWLGNSWSVNSRYSKEISHKFRGENELITQYARWEIAQESGYKYFVFGHWHSPVVYPLTSNETLVLLGDWIVNNTYGKWDGEHFELHRYSNNGVSELISKG